VVLEDRVRRMIEALESWRCSSGRAIRSSLTGRRGGYNDDVEWMEGCS